MLVEVTLALIVILYLSYIWVFGFWDRRKVFNVKFEFTTKVFTRALIKNEYVQDFFTGLYPKYKSHGMIGFYAMFTPMLLLTDPQLIQTLIVKEFNKFNDSGMDLKKEIDPLLAWNPFLTKGMEKWKERRSIQAGNMTTMRFKEIIPIMQRVAEIMVNYVKEKKMEPISAKDLSYLYTVDNSCSTSFGIEPSAFIDPENNFVKYATAEKIFKPSPLGMFCHLFMPTLANILKLRISTEEAEDFFVSFIEKMMDLRSTTNVSKNYFINYMMKVNQKMKEENKSANLNYEVAAHCVTFYVDSTETASNQLAFFLFDLANYQDVQEKLRKEISSISKNPTDFDLEKINSISYLDMAIKESIRIHTQASWISRTCTQDAVIGNAPIPKGTKVFLPIGQLHMDPDYFPNPEKFDPERFSEENKESIPKYTYLPFGEGPRICVGFKFALLQLKMAAIFLLLNFKILPSTEDSKEEIVLDNAPFLTPGSSSKLKFKPILQDESQ